MTLQLEMGYDWEVAGALPCPLQWGLARADTVDGLMPRPQAYFSNVRVGAQLTFYVYDVTALNSGTPASPPTTPQSLGGIWLQTQQADKNTNDPWPFDQNTFNAVTNSQCSLAEVPGGTALSSVFPGGPYPAWQVQASINGTVGPLITTVATAGTYLLTFTISAGQPVNGKTRVQTYVFNAVLVALPAPID